MPARHLYPTRDFPRMEDGDSIPLRWLEDFVQDCMRRIRVAGGPALTPADQARVQREVDSARVFGFEGVRVVYEDELTEVEQLRDAAGAADKLRDALRALRRPDGTLVPDADQRLKALGF